MTSSHPRPDFRTTQWSVIAAAHGEQQSSAALEELCKRYWHPLYAFIRRSGHSANEAEDLTQGFFCQLLEKNYLAQAEPHRGRFRTFLLAAVKHFIANQRQRETAAKRGGGQTVLSLDFQDAEQRYLAEAVENWTPEAIFDREWALSLLTRVLDQLHESYLADGKGELFRCLKPTLVGGAPIAPYADIAKQLETTTGAIKVAVHRLRKSYRQRLNEEIAATVNLDAEVESEQQILLRALHGN